MRISDWSSDVCSSDLAIFVYLSEIEADGRVRYVTEGMLRALLRMETAPPSNYRTSWPYQSLALKDAKPLVPGQWTDLRLALLPTSWTFSEGSRIRVSITGSDCELGTASCGERVCQYGEISGVAV